MDSGMIVLLTLGALSLVVIGIVATAATRAAERREEHLAAAAEAARRQHQLALVGGDGVEELTQSGSYLHIKRAVPVPQGAGLPLTHPAPGGTPPVSFRHTRPAGVTEWTTAAAPAAPPASPPPGSPAERGWVIVNVGAPAPAATGNDDRQTAVVTVPPFTAPDAEPAARPVHIEQA